MKKLIICFLFFVAAQFAFAQLPTQLEKVEKFTGKCKAIAEQIYFVASGQSVIDVFPGSNAGNGFQLNIIGAGANNFEVIQEAFMTSVGVKAGYTNATQANGRCFLTPVLNV